MKTEVTQAEFALKKVEINEKKTGVFGVLPGNEQEKWWKNLYCIICIVGKVENIKSMCKLLIFQQMDATMGLNECRHIPCLSE